MAETKDEFERIAPALCIPDEPSDRGAWLDRQLIGLELRKLVQQLITLGSNRSPEITFADWFEKHRNQVLANGLRSLPTTELEILFRNPTLLMDLQELVFTEGGEYWRSVPISSWHQEAADRVKRKVLQQISAAGELQASDTNALNTPIAAIPAGIPGVTSATEAPAITDKPGALPAPTVSLPKPNAPKGWWIVAAAAMAAAVLIGLFNPFVSTRSNQFFAAAALQSPVDSGQESLKRMSGQIKKDWRTGVASRDQLKSQLVAFRDSCDLLIDGPLVGTLKGLPETSVNDVRDRCRNWKKLASELIANLDSGKPTAEVSSAADAMIEKLTNKLNEIASSA
jgi:hypothetical protein